MAQVLEHLKTLAKDEVGALSHPSSCCLLALNACVSRVGGCQFILERNFHMNNVFTCKLWLEGCGVFAPALRLPARFPWLSAMSLSPKITKELKHSYFLVTS